MRRDIIRPDRLIVLFIFVGLFVVFASCGSEGTNPVRDTIPPQILVTSPSDNTSDVLLENSVSATFSEVIDNATVSATTFQLTRDVRDVPSVISCTGATVTLIPSEPLSLLSAYTVTAKTGIKDTSGNGLAGEYTWSFTTKDGTWGAADRIDAGPGNAVFPRVAVDRDGNAVAVWEQSGGTLTTYRNIWANRYTVASGWGTAQLIEMDDSGDALIPQVGIDSNGNATVVWMQSDGSRFNIRANRYVAGSGWETAQFIETNNGNAMNPKVAVDPSGNAIAMWVQSNGTVNAVWTNRYMPGVGWGTAQILENAGDSELATVAMDGMGNAIAVWNQWDGTRFDIWATQYAAGSGWGTPQRIETNNGSAGAPQIAMNTDGNAVVSWYQSDGILNHILSNQYRFGTGWGTAQQVDTNGTSDAYFPQVGIDSNGNAIVGWYANDGSQWNSWVNMFTFGIGWDIPRLLSPGNVTSSIPQVSMDPYGNAITVWSQWDGVRFNLWANRYRRNLGWDTAQLIDTNDGMIGSMPGIAVHPRGSAVVVWPQSNGTYDQVWGIWFN